MKVFESIKNSAKDRIYNKQVFIEENGCSFNSCQCVPECTENAPFIDFVTLSVFLGLTPQELSEIKTIYPNKLYKTFYIDKRSHKIVPRSFPGKLREINAPVDELKSLQKKLISVFSKFPIHPANNGFVSGKNIYDAASAVKDGETLIHVDLNKFFDNHKYNYVKTKLKEKFKASYNVGLDDYTLNGIMCLITRNSCLPQGAPTSPCLVVALNYEMDEKIAELASKYNLAYSRYADDLAFSGSIDYSTSRKFVKELTKEILPFTINWEKLKIMRTSSKSILTSIEFKKKNKFSKKDLTLVLKECYELFGDSSFNITESGSYKVVSANMDKLDRDTVEANLEILANNLNGIADLAIKPKFYYIQSTKHLLGMNIVNGKINYPRKSYENLRLIAMLLGRQVLFQRVLGAVVTSERKGNTGDDPFSHQFSYREKKFKEKLLNLLNIFAKKEESNNPNYRNLLENPLDINNFWGIMSHLHTVDQAKEVKLLSIIFESYKRCYDQLVVFLTKMDQSGLSDCLPKLVPENFK